MKYIAKKMTIVRILVIGICLITSVKIVSHYQSQDKWETFRSQLAYPYASIAPVGSPVYPDGFTLDIPASWKSTIYVGQYHNRKNLKAVFSNSTIFPATQSLGVYWKRVDTTLTQDDLMEWERELFDYWRYYKPSPMQEISVGQNQYPAITRTYDNGQETIKIVLLSTHKEAFMLVFQAKMFDSQAQAVFDRMLTSWEVTK